MTEDEMVNHPSHYGGPESPYEAIKVIEAWGLGFALGNAVKYICRAGRKTRRPIEDLKKARWYLDREITRLTETASRSQGRYPDRPPVLPSTGEEK